MTVFDKKLNLWIIDDLAPRRDRHEEIIKESLENFSIFKIAHPVHLERVLEIKIDEVCNDHNLFFSDFNMHWSNVDWTEDLSYTENLKMDSELDDFYGTQKVLDRYKNKLNNFLLIMLSTMVVEEGYHLNSKLSLVETSNKAWDYEDLPIRAIDIDLLHKLSKPFSKDKLFRVLKHYQHLIKDLTK